METAQVVKTIYEILPPEAQKVFDTIFLMGGAKQRVKLLKDKADRVMPAKQTELSDLRKQLNDIWIDCKKNALQPDVTKVQSYDKQITALTKEVHEAQNEANCGLKHRNPYSEAARIWEGDMYSGAEIVKGKKITALRSLNEGILLRISDEKRKRRNANK